MAPMMRRFASRPARSSRGGHLPDANGFLIDADDMLSNSSCASSLETLPSGGVMVGDAQAVESNALQLSPSRSPPFCAFSGFLHLSEQFSGPALTLASEAQWVAVAFRQRHWPSSQRRTRAGSAVRTKQGQAEWTARGSRRP
jgi:hypothetical protein